MDAKKLLVENGYEGVKVLENYSYDDALIGVSEDNRAIYDFELMVLWLMDNKGLEVKDAVEWIEQNTLKALPYMGEGAPIILYRLFK